MKLSIHSLTAFLFIGLTSFSQTTVKLDIKHFQGTKVFSPAQTSTTMSGESYNAARLEYYISEIGLEHDGGTITEIDSFWILVNALIPSVINLGDYNITSLEAITFSIGVENPTNHADPSLWPVGHPLAPKSPSMHWGWVSGYRYFAMEGKCGSTMSGNYELHSLGDNFYYDQRIETSGTDDNGDLLITLNADYDRVFDDISLNNGVIDHGEFDNNIQFLKNVRDRVFTSTEGNGNSLSPILGINDSEFNQSLKLYPNPSNGQFSIELPDDLNFNTKLIVYNALGEEVLRRTINPSSNVVRLDILQEGYYVVALVDNKGAIARSSIVITE